MSARASRRQVLAAITLQADLPAPNEITFTDSGRIDIGLDSVTDLHAWLAYFGMSTKSVATQPYTRKDGSDAGQTSTLANVYGEWRGWRVHLHALDPIAKTDLEVDDATRDQLHAVADEPAPHRQVAGSVGAPGQCSAECACGVVFDGFDTVAEAAALLDNHIDAAAAKAGAV